jgi:hypothetical protein
MMTCLGALGQHRCWVGGIEAGEPAVAADHGVERGDSSEVRARPLDSKRAEDGLRTDTLPATFWTGRDRWRGSGSGIGHLSPPWRGCRAGLEPAALAPGTGTHR